MSLLPAVIADYGPFRAGESPGSSVLPTHAEMDEDLAILSHVADAVRIYTVEDGLDYIVQHAAQYGLQAIPSAFLVHPVPNVSPIDDPTNKKELDDLVNLLNHTDLSNIPFVVIGNEAISQVGGWSDGDIINAIEYVKSKVPAGIKFTTAESWFEQWYNPDPSVSDHRTNLGKSADIDLIFPIIQPFSEGAAIGDAVNTVLDHYNKLKTAYQGTGKEIVISETGWPSTGSNAVNEESFWKNFITTAANNGIKYAGFEAFDEPYKQPSDPEAHWGLYDVSRAAKTSVRSLLPGAQTFIGGVGDDTYIVHNRSDWIVEAAGQGNDTVQADVSYTLTANVENLVLTGSANLIGNGNGSNNSITGNSGDNFLYGNDGADILRGGPGNDAIDGGAGIDSAVFSGLRSAYTITALAGNAIRVSGPDGTDTLTNIEKLVFDDQTVNLQTHWIASVDVGPHPAGWLPAGVGDFNNDATGDLAWYNSATGDLDLWKFANGKWAGSVDVGAHPAGWQPAGVGDFNHDGTSDVLWYNPTTRDLDLWKIANGQWAGSVDIGSHPAGWQPAGVGDFNHDGTGDVLWYNPTTGDADIWKIVNGQWAGSVDVGLHPLGWQPVGIGDFNHDGTSDVLWYNPTTRDLDLWKISNGQWAGSTDIGTHPAGWAPAGVGDFNNDGTSDVLWFNAATSDAEIWQIANGQWAGSVDLGSHPGGWVPVGIGDFNHDGTIDILWREASTGRIDEWQLANGL